MSNMMMIEATDSTFKGAQAIPEQLFASGKPTAEVWVSTSFGCEGVIRAGIWVGESGSINVPSYPEDEIFTVLSGQIDLTEEGGGSLSVGPGQSCCIRKGWKGVWTNAEQTRKCYVIVAAS